MNKMPSGEIREAAVAVASSVAEAAEIPGKDSSGSVGIEDDARQLLPKGVDNTVGNEDHRSVVVDAAQTVGYHSTAENENDGIEAAIKVFTLNCWGLKFVSKLRRERFKAIAEYLTQPPGSRYDVIFLQEVWVNEDYEQLREKLTRSSDLYPYAHYFDNGIIGSGTCIFSKVRLQDANYHEFAMNGYPTNFWHGDWFASKGIGVCQIRLGIDHPRLKSKNNFFSIHLYVSHYHANYDPTNDIYLGHRVIHAFESAQWINLTSSAADLTIYAGDFNTEPQSLPYRILRNVAPLQDAWEYCARYRTGSEPVWTGGYTNELPTNSFCATDVTQFDSDRGPVGHRIDYVMYSPGPDVIVTPLSCAIPLPNRIPGKDYSFSDHEAVDAVIRITRRHRPAETKHCVSCKREEVQIEAENCSIAEFKRAQSIETRLDCVKSVQEAIKVMDRSMQSVDKSQKIYAIYTFLLSLLLIVSFLPSGIEGLGVSMRITLDLCLFIPRLALTAGIVIFALMGSLFSKRERNAFRETKNELNLVLDQDVGSPPSQETSRQ